MEFNANDDKIVQKDEYEKFMDRTIEMLKSTQNI